MESGLASEVLGGRDDDDEAYGCGDDGGRQECSQGEVPRTDCEKYHLRVCERGHEHDDDA